ncbi:MAG TPA: heme NO-binding domain-containing protein, partial [Polyangiales bacterium]|nr:heme NO-binding domain-containing protein [Polyangiales bacterium]
MYGLVNAAFRELIVSLYGHDQWERVRLAVVPDEDTFSAMEQYPDEITYQMVQRTCEITGCSSDDLLIKFGELWVVYTDRQGYGALFEIAGPSLPDFLMALNDLHARVGRNFPKLRPPTFRFDVIDSVAFGSRAESRVSTLRMHYLTRRTGLCPFVRGLLQGLSARFRTPVAVEHPVCQRLGA